jgi:putative intracellular protease/amidase
LRRTVIGLIVSCGISLLALLWVVAARSACPDDLSACGGGKAGPCRPVLFPPLAFALPGRPGDHPVAVAILLFDGVQIIDYSGPWEVFGESGYRVFTVAEGAGPVTTVFGEKVLPSFTFANAPDADILVVPGGSVHDRVIDDAALVRWVGASRSGTVLSVCTGAFILARAGLLDGLKATTYHGSIGDLARAAPRATIVPDERFVDNGRIVVTAGLSSGIDGALHIVERLSGLGTAEATALNMEYDWNRAGGYARAALADKYQYFIRTALPGPYVRREGDRDRWIDEWVLQEPASAQDAMSRVNRVISGGAGWRRLDGPDSDPKGPSRWSFEDESGREWIGVARVEPLEGNTDMWVVSLEIERSTSRSGTAKAAP